MTAPDSRDSVERVVAEMRAHVKRNGVFAAGGITEQWADRLQALVRGPQQAGGEDVIRGLAGIAHSHRHLSAAPIKAIELITALQAEVARLREAGRDAARYRWLRRKIDPDTIDAVIEDDFDLRESQSRDVDAAIDAARLVRDGDSGEG